MREQRRHPRVKRSVPGNLRARRLLLLNGPRQEIDMLDVSRGGFRICTPVPLSGSTRVVLGLRSRFLRRMVRFEGRVVWSSRITYREQPCTLAGVKLLETSPEGALMLHRMVTGQGTA